MHVCTCTYMHMACTYMHMACTYMHMACTYTGVEVNTPHDTSCTIPWQWATSLHHSKDNLIQTASMEIREHKHEVVPTCLYVNQEMAMVLDGLPQSENANLRTSTSSQHPGSFSTGNGWWIPTVYQWYEHMYRVVDNRTSSYYNPSRKYYLECLIVRQVYRIVSNRAECEYGL